MKKLLQLILLLTLATQMIPFASAAKTVETGSVEFSSPAAQKSFDSHGNLAKPISSSEIASMLISKNGVQTMTTRSTGCSVGCSVGCSTGCSVGCSVGCSIGCRR